MTPKILLLEDDRSVRESLNKLLKREGYDVYPAQDVSEAIEILQSNNVQLFVLDLNLATDHDWKLLEAANPLKPNLPAILVTGAWGQRESAAAHDILGFIEKPIDVVLFLDRIRGVLAEPSCAKRKRAQPVKESCDDAIRHNESFLRMLHERYSTPFAISYSSTMPVRRWPAALGHTASRNSCASPVKSTPNNQSS
ncbi:MAG TPA: response regulator [Candidatus Paceibacterota bacterium]|nr:response regulator [Verrucomicrobiota bacterium]HRY50420.1 response regulator [Candidatus Paceibacterota bacterium]